jgi:hypothetical protein
MSGIGAVTPANTQPSVEEQQAPDRDAGKRQPRPPRKRVSKDEMVEVEPRSVDFEA